jgi:hypothetical protein
MSRLKVWSVAAAVALAGGMATAQTPVTNLFPNLSEVGVTLGASLNDNAAYPLLSLTLGGNQGEDAGAPKAGFVGSEDVFDADAQVSLWDPVSSRSLTGTQALFLSDLDFGQAGSLARWGAIVTAIPEPSTLILAALGGIALGLRFLRPRVGR